MVQMLAELAVLHANRGSFYPGIGTCQRLQSCSTSEGDQGPATWWVAKGSLVSHHHPSSLRPTFSNDYNHRWEAVDGQPLKAGNVVPPISSVHSPRRLWLRRNDRERNLLQEKNLVEVRSHTTRWPLILCEFDVMVQSFKHAPFPDGTPFVPVTPGDRWWVIRLMFLFLNSDWSCTPYGPRRRKPRPMSCLDSVERPRLLSARARSRFRSRSSRWSGPVSSMPIRKRGRRRTGGSGGRVDACSFTYDGNIEASITSSPATVSGNKYRGFP